LVAIDSRPLASSGRYRRERLTSIGKEGRVHCREAKNVGKYAIFRLQACCSVVDDLSGTLKSRFLEVVSRSVDCVRAVSSGDEVELPDRARTIIGAARVIECDVAIRSL